MAFLDKQRIRGYGRYFLMRAGGFDMFNGQRVEDSHGTNGEDKFGKNHYMRDFQNARRFKPGNTPVRQKFNGYVNFNFNPEVDLPVQIDGHNDIISLSSLIRQSGIPSAEIQTDVKNQYNRKRITVTHTEFKPIQMVAYDTVDSKWVSVLMAAYQHLFMNPSGKFQPGSGAGDPLVPVQTPHDIVPGAVPSGDGSGFSSFNDKFDSNFMGLRLQPQAVRNFIDSIDIVQYHGQKCIKYTLFRPMITNFEIDGIDHSSSEANLITMDITYENFAMQPIINEFITEDDLQRFSDFNRGHWSRLRDGDPNTDDIPGGSRANSRNPVWDKPRQENFTDAVNRNKQNDWLGNFANNSTAGATGNKEIPKEQGAKKDTSIQQDKTGPQGAGPLTDEEAAAMADEYNAAQAAAAGFGGGGSA